MSAAQLRWLEETTARLRAQADLNDRISCGRESMDGRTRGLRIVIADMESRIAELKERIARCRSYGNAIMDDTAAIFEARLAEITGEPVPLSPPPAPPPPPSVPDVAQPFTAGPQTSLF